MLGQRTPLTYKNFSMDGHPPPLSMYPPDCKSNRDRLDVSLKKYKETARKMKGLNPEKLNKEIPLRVTSNSPLIKKENITLSVNNSKMEKKTQQDVSRRDSRLAFTAMDPINKEGEGKVEDYVHVVRGSFDSEEINYNNMVRTELSGTWALDYWMFTNSKVTMLLLILVVVGVIISICALTGALPETYGLFGLLVIPKCLDGISSLNLNISMKLLKIFDVWYCKVYNVLFGVCGSLLVKDRPNSWCLSVAYFCSALICIISIFTDAGRPK